MEVEFNIKEMYVKIKMRMKNKKDMKIIFFLFSLIY